MRDVRVLELAVLLLCPYLYAYIVQSSPKRYSRFPMSHTMVHCIREPSVMQRRKYADVEEFVRLYMSS
jgi:hypothetical protein